MSDMGKGRYKTEDDDEIATPVPEETVAPVRLLRW
jgi:hypothetical protein